MKRLLLFVVSALLLLTACGAPPQVTETGDVEEPNETAGEETAAQEAAGEETAGQETASNTAALASPATTIEEASELRQGDWVKGAEEPLLSVVEYGDFQ